MITIILSASAAVKEKAIAAGFKEATVLTRFDSVQSTEQNKHKLEAAMFALRPYQFLVSDFWGASVE